jgi:hypothetical protein
MSSAETVAAVADNHEPRTRRALLAAGLGGLAAWVAGMATRVDPAQAAAGSPIVLGTANDAGISNTTIKTNSSGIAMQMNNLGTGVGGFFLSTSGTGAASQTSSGDKWGTSATNQGVASGIGGAVLATGKQNIGLRATTAGAGAVAIHATTSGVSGTAALFEVASTGPTEFAAGPAVRAYTAGGTNSTVHPTGSYRTGAGEFAGPIGVIGASTGTNADENIGLLGTADAGNGVRGLSNSSRGVWGTSSSGPGVHASSDSGNGLYAETVTGFAAVFNGRTSHASYADITEISDPSSPPANTARLFVHDNQGKSELCVLFPTGSVIVIAAEA